MQIEFSRIQQLIERPSESLSVEIKRWIDPDQQDGIAKIVRTALALRNQGGGYLVIGFDNETLQPDKNNIPQDVRSAFHVDKIQGLISRFASEPFEVAVEFPEREGQSYPVIVIPSGVKTPVAAKSDLRIDDTKNKAISAGDVYVRSLRANNTPSTTKAGWKDWPKIAEVCFDNREADIGRFLRRHLSGVTPDMVRELASSIIKEIGPKATIEEIVRRYLQGSEGRYLEVIKEKGMKLPDHGAWEVALLLVGDVPSHIANQQFLNLLDSSNPNYTGWPVWLDSRGFRDISARPYVFDGVWEALIVSTDIGWDMVDFMRLDPKGRFYLRRALEDDISDSPPARAPLSVLDFGLPILHTAEAIAVGIAFAKGMGCAPEKTVLAFAFRWTKLRGRVLGSWAQRGRYISPGRRAYQDDLTVFINVPLETPLSAIGEFVNQAVQQLFQLFDGFILGKDIVEDLTQGLLERKR